MFNWGTLCHLLAKSAHFVQRLYINDFFLSEFVKNFMVGNILSGAF